MGAINKAGEFALTGGGTLRAMIEKLADASAVA
jgi:hypothetical protein